MHGEVSDFFESLWDQILKTTWMEWLSTVSQLVSVWYARANNILVYPTGIIGVILAAYLYLFVSAPPLYGEGILHLYYFGMSVFGWYRWVQRRPEDQSDRFPISYLAKQEWFWGLAFVVGSYAVIFGILAFFTDSDTVVLDALVSSSAILAMYWMAGRKIENWWAWIFSNLVAIPLNFYKGFVLFAVMYLLFLILAVMGYHSWKRLIKVS